MTYHHDIAHTVSELNDRYPWALRIIAMFVAGLCWGASLGLLGAPLEASLWFALAIFALVMAAYVASRRIRAVHKNLLLLSATFMICIGLGIGTWLAG